MSPAVKLLALFIQLLVASVASNLPAMTDYQRVLQDALGNPKGGSFDRMFRFYDRNAEKWVLLADSRAGDTAVKASNGIIAADLGGGKPPAGGESTLAAALATHNPVWMDFQIAPELVRVTSRAFILALAGAQNADGPDGMDSTAFLTAEPDPKVGALTSKKWCQANGDGTMNLSASSLTVDYDGVVGNEVTDATNATLVRSGTGTMISRYTLGINLANANTWTAAQTIDGPSDQTQLKVQGSYLQTNSIFEIQDHAGVGILKSYATQPVYSQATDTSTEAHSFNVMRGAEWPTSDSATEKHILDLKMETQDTARNFASERLASLYTSLTLNGSGTVDVVEDVTSIPHLNTGASKTVGKMTAFYARPQNISATAAGTVFNMISFESDPQNYAGGGIVTNVYGLKINNPSGGGIFGNKYGVYQLGNDTVNYFAGTIQSDIATGTAPFSIASTTLNTNLNADLLDGQHAAAFLKAETDPRLPASGAAGNVLASTGLVWTSAAPAIGLYAPEDTSYFVGPSKGFPRAMTGTMNQAFGPYALAKVTTGSNNVAFGRATLSNILDGSYNTAFGDSTLQSATSGKNNTAFGSHAAGRLTTGTLNTVVGQGALEYDITGHRNSACGQYGLLYTDADDNTGMGYYALAGNYTGTKLSSLGARTNISVKAISIADNTNPVTIHCGGHGFSSGNHIFIYGVSGMNQLNGNSYTITRTGNDEFTLNGIDGTGWAPGSGGKAAINDLTNSTAIGYGATITTSNQIVLGDANATRVDTAATIYAKGGFSGALTGVASGNLTVEADGVIGNEVTSATNATLTRSGIGSADNPYTLALNLSNANIWTGIQAFIAGTKFPGNGMWNAAGNVGIGMDSPSYQLQLSADSAGKLSTNTWFITSDRRLKKDIAPFRDGMSVIEKINPVTYRFNGLGGTPLDYPGIGVVAQEIKDIAPYTVGTFMARLEARDSSETELYNFNSHALTFVLINAVKELDERTKRLEGKGSIYPRTRESTAEPKPIAEPRDKLERDALAPNMEPIPSMGPMLQMFPAIEGIEPGDVLGMNAANGDELHQCNLAADPMVVGVAAAATAEAGLPAPDSRLPGSGMRPVVVAGITLVKADATLAPIAKGDLLVASHIPGHAMKMTSFVPGTIIGKALENLENGTGMVRVLVMLR